MAIGTVDSFVSTRLACDVLTHTRAGMQLYMQSSAPEFALQCPKEPQKRLTYAIIANMVGLLDVQQPTSPNMFKTAFTAREIPLVSPSEYALFLFASFQCSLSTALYTFIYLERAARAHHDVQMTPYTVHRLLLSAFVVACKYVEDGKFSMQAFAHVGGVGLNDLLTLEVSFIKLTCCNLYVSQETFNMCKVLALTIGKYSKQDVAPNPVSTSALVSH